MDDHYKRWAARFVERVKHARTTPGSPVDAARFFGPEVVHAPRQGAELLVVRSSVDGRLFALGSDSNGDTIAVEVER
jgi:hypothetical protein